MKKRYAIVSYNMYGNFTNYGSALQTYALHRTLNELAPQQVQGIVLNYCPDVLRDKDILNPMKDMWDLDEDSRKMCELSLSAIRINYEKFQCFYRQQYTISSQMYTSDNFQESLEKEHLDGYICGSDTIWCISEFKGFDNGYFANYPVMKNSHTISYAASFGDAVFEGEDEEMLRTCLQNYKAIGVRENTNIEFIKKNTSVPVRRVLDPTLLLKGEEYHVITQERLIQEPYILLYARRYNKAMEEYADTLAEKMGCKIVEISLRAVNAPRHIMFYEAGVEEFLSLTKYAEFVVTNSFHGAIFSIQMHTQFRIFSREQADTKIDELLEWLHLEECKLISGQEEKGFCIEFDAIEERLQKLRWDSLSYLKTALKITH